MTAAPDSATLEKLLADAAPGPWEKTKCSGEISAHIGEYYVARAIAAGSSKHGHANASLIAAAPDLAAEVLALRAENAELQSNLEAATAECGALMIVGDALADVLDRPVQSDGKLGQYCYRWGAVDAALDAYREARK